MTAERRNLYRLLHVQPEAPTEIIKASYRALMSTLRMHPDLGGDPQRAAEVNHAYAVLMDPERRRAYDLSLKAARSRPTAASGPASPKPAAPAAPPAAQARAPGAARPAGAPAPRGTPSPDRGPAAPRSPAATGSGSRGGAPAAPAAAAEPPTLPLEFESWRADRRCPFCRTGFRVVLRPETRCVTCDSPLMPAPDARGAAREILGRRGSQRHPRDQDVTLRLPGVAQDQAARLRNLSLTGMALACSVRVQRGSVVRVITPQFDALVGVVHQRSATAGFQLHGTLLTLQLMRQNQGVFVSVKI